MLKTIGAALLQGGEGPRAAVDLDNRRVISCCLFYVLFLCFVLFMFVVVCYCMFYYFVYCCIYLLWFVYCFIVLFVLISIIVV